MTLAVCVVTPSSAQESTAWGYTTYGIPGLIDMPAAPTRPDGELAFNVSHFRNQTRNTLTFQVTPRLSASFRYANLYDVAPDGGEVVDFRFDRSFSVHYRIADEERWRPALAFGINDILGTGFYSSEYVVATKNLGSRLRVSVGLGWGRLAGVNGFSNPLNFLGEEWDTRDFEQSGFGGEFNASNWFRGDAALFGGIEWQATDRLRLIAEYSSDDYPFEDPYAFTQNSPVNLGLSYALTPSWTLSANYLYGSELGIQLGYDFNPRFPRHPSGLDPAPPPVLTSPADPTVAASFDLNEGGAFGAESRAERELAAQGLFLHGFTLSGDAAFVEIENPTYREAAQAVGRTARALTRTMPSNVTTFSITLIERGLPVSTTTVRRADLEALEHEVDGSWELFARAQVTDAGPGTDPQGGLFPRFTWGLTPTVSTSLFEPDAPLRVDLGATLSASYEIAPGLELSGAIYKPLLGNLGDSDIVSDSVLPHVRSDSAIYAREGDPAITSLTAAWRFRPAENLYGRVTVGYLEPMFGGVSTELLWKRDDSPFGLGVEVNMVRQRDYDQRLGFQDYEVVTGHVSGYWDLGGYHAQVDLGRYLAGDWGGTLTLDREFGNGWRVGGFATLTDVPFEEFGEGSFDKGIRLTIPLDYVLGRPTRQTRDFIVRPVLRDGGARLDVEDRLYEVVRDEQGIELQDGWGRFWR